jgi:hypothetical protein
MKNLNETQLRNIIREAVQQYTDDVDLMTGEPLGKEYLDKINARVPKELKGRCQRFMQQISYQMGNISIMQSYCDDDWRHQLREAESHLNKAYKIVLSIYKQIEGESTVNGEPIDIFN